MKSYKKVSRWYPALEPAGEQAARVALDTASGGTEFGDDTGPARYPHYIHDDEPELDIPPVPDSLLRRNNFSGAWSDWMTGRETDSYAPRVRYRGATVVEFPTDTGESAEPGSDRASALLDAVDDDPATPPGTGRGKRLLVLAFLIFAVLLLAVAGGVALYVLNSHGGAAQSLGTSLGDARFDSSRAVAAYNEMTATMKIGDHIPAARIPAG
ncbi:hypothetical protein [Nocardia inohanensis]|uniref:hypothetical protein n=1 Tax=Nocardia inohanensis TaxID=209246 RepID=UPI00147178F6|nr:hypothetical protein [Nocardia inohanensis]